MTSALFSSSQKGALRRKKRGRNYLQIFHSFSHIKNIPQTGHIYCVGSPQVFVQPDGPGHVDDDVDVFFQCVCIRTANAQIGLLHVSADDSDLFQNVALPLQ